MQQRDGALIQFADRLAAGADGMQAIRSQVIEDGFADEGAAGIASAQKKDVHDKPLVRVEK